MEEDDAFVPYLASLLEVSIVEDSVSTVALSEAGESAKQSDGTEENNTINVNGVAVSNPESSSKVNSTDVPCPHVDEQDEVQDSACHEVLMPESQPETIISEEEKQMYDSVFKDLKKVMYLRLHCTVCDCHIGCTPAATFTMASHKILRVLVCINCDTFYGNGDFPCGDDGSETFCRWCGQGGKLYCCSLCPSVFCKKCIRRNLGKKTVQMIEESSDWRCFRCNLQPIWEHRALCWGLSNFLKEQSKAENKIPADVVEKSPGFKPSLCCQGEKHAYYRAGQPLRNLVPSFARDTLKIKDIQTLMSPSSEMNILRNTLTLGRQALDTTPTSITKMSSNMDSGKVDLNIPVSALSTLQSVSIVTTQEPNNKDKSVQRLMPVKSPNADNVSDSAVKISEPETPFRPGVGVTNSTLLASQKRPLLTYESAFLSHFAQSSVQNQTLHKNQNSHQNSAVPVTDCVAGSNPSANLHASMPLTYVRVPVGTVMSPRSNSSAGPTVNKVYINKNNNFNNLPHTMPSSSGSTAQHTQCRTTQVPTYYIVSMSPYEVPKLLPVSSFRNPPFLSSGHTRLTRLPYPNTTLQKNVENVVSENAFQVKDDNPSVDDDDIIEVFSNVQNSNDSVKITCEWMMKAFRKIDCTSRILAYHMEVLQQKFISEMKGKDVSAKGIRQLARKFHHLLVKASNRLNFEKEFVSKEFSDWLCAERAKHGFPVTKEKGPNSSPTDGNISDAETTQEPELLLDMEISYESDHEDVSSLNSGVKQDLIECTENLSDNDSDSEDPFSDSEGTERGKFNPVFRPFFSRTVRELLKDKFSSKLLLQLLTEHHSKTENTQKRCVFPTKGLPFADVSTQTDATRGEKVTAEEKETKSTQNKKVSSTKEIQFIDVSTQTDAPRREEFTVGEKEPKITQNKRVSFTKEIHFIDVSTQTVAPTVEENKSKTSKPKPVWSCAYTDFLTTKKSDRISSSSSDFSLHSDEITTDLGTKYEKHGKTKSVNPNSKAIEKSQMESSLSRLEDSSGDECEKGQTPCKNNSIGNAQISKAETETNSILMNGDTAPIQSGYASERNCRSVAVKRKYHCAESCSDLSPGVWTDHSCDTLKVVKKKVRANNQNSHSSSSSIMLPKRTKVDSKIPVTDFTALANSALQKKLIKPCSVSVMKLNRIY